MVSKEQAPQPICPDSYFHTAPSSDAVLCHDLVVDHGPAFIRLLNAVLGLFNLPPLRWLNSSQTALSVVIVSVWKSIGYYALIITAALKAIPSEIYEAAALDNSPKYRVFFRSTLPMLSPQLFFLLIVITINSFKVFDTIRIMTEGGPGNATDVLVYYIYRYAFQHFRIGYASAAGTVLMVILMILTVIYFALLGRRVHYQ